MNVIDVLEELEAHGSRNKKLEILTEHAKCLHLKEVFAAVDNPYVNYGVGTLSRQTTKHELSNEDEIDKIDELLNVILPSLQTREVKGTAARLLITGFFSTLNERTYKWCKRILLRNLRNGVQSKLAEQVWPDYVPKFSVALAQSVDLVITPEGIVGETGLKYPLLVEPKLDGLRCIAVKEAGKVQLYTRSGREICTLPKIVETLERGNYDNIVLDGEAMGADWNESASVIGSTKNKKDDTGIVYNVFDSVTLNEWKAAKCKEPFSSRSKRAQDIVTKISSPFIKKVQGVLVGSDEELFITYTRAINNGYEGVMLKDSSAVYIFKRSKALLKMKPVATYEGIVVDVFMGRDSTRLEGSAGGIVVKLPNGVCTDVGSGFSDSERLEIASNVNKYIGRFAEVEGQPPLTEEGKIRFPTFKRWRSFDDLADDVRALKD